MPRPLYPQGKLIEAPDGSKAKILARIGSLIFRSDWYLYDTAHYRPFTVEEAEKMGWQVLDVDGRKPYTIKELERLMPNVRIVTRSKKK